MPGVARAALASMTSSAVQFQQLESKSKITSAQTSPDTSGLFIITGGWNDIAAYGMSPATIVSNMSNHVSTLAAAGGTHFLVPNLVPLGSSPGVRKHPALNQTAAELNELVRPELTRLESQLGITVYQDDFYGLIESVIADPTAFGLENATSSANRNAQSGHVLVLGQLSLHHSRPPTSGKQCRCSHSRTSNAQNAISFADHLDHRRAHP